jgi:Tfp pilus assembly protein PilF
MNSWHSWSPNGKWLVFASKAFTPYTQLFLTHMDERGQSTPPVLLEQFTTADRAANIPEFVNVPPDGIVKIRERFLDDYSYVSVALANVNAGDLEQAEQASRRALAINPNNPRALGFLGSALTARRQYDEAERCFRESLKSEPDSPFVHLNFGLLLLARGQQEQGLAEMRAAVELEPDVYDARFKLGTELLKAEQFPEAETHLSEAVRIWASNVNARCGLAQTLHAQGKDEAALTQFRAALTQNANYALGLLGMARVYAESSQPGIRNPVAAVQLAERAARLDARQRAQALLMIAGVHADAGRYAEAVSSATAALTLAMSQGQEEFAAEIRRRLDRYRANAK